MSQPRRTRRLLIASLLALSLILGSSFALLRVTGRSVDAVMGLDFSLSASSKSTPALRMTASPTRVTAGESVRFSVASSTKHPRTVRLQQWNSKKKSWQTITSRTVRGTTTWSLSPPAGAWMYRASAPKMKDRIGGKKHTHKASSTPAITIRVAAKLPVENPTTATLTAQETQLLTAVRAARSEYAPAKKALDATSADNCLTTYARTHTAWMATQDRALDPGSAGHAKASRPLPNASCSGRTIQSLTSAVGTTTHVEDAIAVALNSWLASPYGATDRLLSTCTNAKSYDFGVSANKIGDAWWFTVLVSSPSTTTSSSGVC